MSDATSPQVEHLPRTSVPPPPAELPELAAPASVLPQDLSRVWTELEGRGEDLSDLRLGIAAYLPAIASGHLDPRLVIEMAGRPALLRLLAPLPPERQRALLDGESVPVVQPVSMGQPTPVVVSRTLAELTVKDLQRVVDGTRLLSTQEQQARLSLRARVSATPVGRPLASLDADPEYLRVGRHRVAVAELLALLAARFEATAGPIVEDDAAAVSVRLKADEQKGLRVRAAHAGMTMGQYLRSLAGANGASIPLVRLVYSSQTSTPPDPLAVDKILTNSRHANRAAGLSGLLVHHLTHYMQCLEGTPDAVEAAFARIRQDARHHDVITHFLEPITDRAFGSWYMAYAAVGNSAWTMLERVDWTASDVITPSQSRGFMLLERVWELYRNTRQADRGPPDG